MEVVALWLALVGVFLATVRLCKMAASDCEERRSLLRGTEEELSRPAPPAPPPPPPRAKSAPPRLRPKPKTLRFQAQGILLSAHVHGTYRRLFRSDLAVGPLDFETHRVVGHPIADPGGVLFAAFCAVLEHPSLLRADAKEGLTTGSRRRLAALLHVLHKAVLNASPAIENAQVEVQKLFLPSSQWPLSAAEVETAKELHEKLEVEVASKLDVHSLLTRSPLAHAHRQLQKLYEEEKLSENAAVFSRAALFFLLAAPLFDPSEATIHAMQTAPTPVNLGDGAAAASLTLLSLVLQPSVDYIPEVKPEALGAACELLKHCCAMYSCVLRVGSYAGDSLLGNMMKAETLRRALELYQKSTKT